MSDVVCKIGGSTVQHGPDSRRVYLMKLDPADLPALTGQLDALARENGYTKIFAKVPEPHADMFLQQGYRCEGRIPRFYGGQTAAMFLGRYFDSARARESRQQELDAIVKLAVSKRGVGAKAPLPDGYRLRPAVDADAEALAALYRVVFASYPFPIHEPAYLLETMRSHVCYFVAEKDGELVAAASGEMDRSGRNAEMTDFATLPVHLGHGLAVHLLKRMEPEMRSQGMATLYTIARAVSPGMNITFAKCGYRFGGMLINNTQISGAIESMNLWSRGAGESN